VQARVTKQTVTFMVDQLERAGYVRRVPDPSTRGSGW
jgi:DNA-binding MarR family transcriptional regulator